LAKSARFKWEDLANSKVGKINAFSAANLALLSNAKPAKKSKYGNIKTVVDGIRFDSQGEGARYSFLKRQLSAGKIRNLRLQVPYELTSKIAKTDTAKAVQAMKYKADFVYINVSTGLEVVEDFKGRLTQEYKLKRKLMRDKHDIEIYETTTEHLKAAKL
jgi:hypothetical protein